MDNVTFMLNGKHAVAEAGCSVAVAVLTNGITTFRRSVDGQPRAPLCGMGICFECRVEIDGKLHQKSCQVPLQAGMAVTTDE